MDNQSQGENNNSFAITIGCLEIKISNVSKEQMLQIVEKMKQYDFTDIATILSLIDWAEGRRLNLKVKIRSWWKPQAWATALLVYLYRNTQAGHDFLKPVKR